MSSESEFHQWNCLNCRRRKVRCDRHYPCSQCVKGDRECVFPNAGRVFRRPERPPALVPSQAGKAELMGRIRRLESVVDSLHSELQTREQDPSRETPNAGSSGNEKAASKPDKDSSYYSIPERDSLDGVEQQPSVTSRVTAGEEKGDLYIGDRFWAVLRREIKFFARAFDEIEDDDDDGAGLDSGFTPNLATSRRGSLGTNSGFLFPSFRGASNGLEELRPLPSQMLFIWQSFLDNVSPYLQAMHMPSVEKSIRECRGRIELLGPTMEPLLFAVSLAAIVPLSNDDVRVNFNRERADMMQQLRVGTELALARADFINSSSLSVMQAFVIYVFVLRRDESPRYTWSLIGLLTRMAISMGLHRDGSCFPNMSVFEAEIRRRLWWQICFIECRIGDSLGDNQVTPIGITEQNFDTREPLNVNDADLYPEMVTLPEPSSRFTDTSVTLMRCDKWKLFQDMSTVVDQIGRDQDVSDAAMAQKLETLSRYRDVTSLRFADTMDESLRISMATMSRVHANSFELIIRHLQQPKMDTMRPDDRSFTLALAVIEDVHEFHYSEMTRKLSWIHGGFLMHWQPMAILLCHLSYRPWDHTSEHAWRLVKEVLQRVPDVVQTDPLWHPLSKLLNKTHRHREQHMEQQSRSSQFASPETQHVSSSNCPPKPQNLITAITPKTSTSSAMATSRSEFPETRPLVRDTDVTASSGVDWDWSTFPPFQEPARSRRYPSSQRQINQAQKEDQLELRRTPISGTKENEAAGTGDDLIQDMEWEDWNDIIRNGGQSLLWGLENI